MRADWDGHADGAEWTQVVLDSIAGSTLLSNLPVDVNSFWTGYEAAGTDARTEFWLMLISAVARCESNFDPNCVYNEPPPLNQKSIGLMQLSLTDNSYGCGFADEDSIKNPRLNLGCAVKILTKLIGSASRIGGDEEHSRSGAAAYWSTLRASNDPKRNPRAHVIKCTSSLG